MSCPDRKLLSVYTDGELDSPWKEKVEAHIGSCPFCAEITSSYASLSGIVAKSCDAREEAVLARMRVTPPAGFSTGAEYMGPHVGNVLPFWRRRVGLPLPVVSAAAVVMSFAIVFAIVGNSSQSDRKSSQPSIAKTVISAQPANFEALVRSIDAQGGDSVMTIMLPGETTIQSAGEPVLMTASAAPGGSK